MALEASEKRSRVALCSVASNFKSLLIFIYKLINSILSKLAGISVKSTWHRHNMEKPNSNNNNRKESEKVKEIWEIPGPRSLPFFGTLFTSAALKSTDLMKSNEEREKLYGPIVKEEHFWNVPFIMVLGTEEIKKIARTNSLARPSMEIVEVYRTLRPDRYNSFGIVNSQGNAWKNLHTKFATHLINTKFARSLLPGFNGIVKDAISILEIQPQNQPTNVLSEVLNKLIAEASFHISFGRRAIIGRENEIRKKFEVFTNCHQTYWLAFHQSMYGFPWWKYLSTNVWKNFVEAEDKMFDLIDEMTEELLQSGTAGGFLAAVPKDQIDRNDLNVVLLELLSGATEPAYHSLIIALYWISKNEHVYTRVLEELREQMPTKDSPVDENVLANIPYLKACVTEAFRICPSTGNIARFLEKEMEVGGYRLPQWTPVILQYWHACLKDSNFYRAKEFLPERWLLDDGIPPYTPHDRQVMKNFGYGMRECPGRKVATLLIHTFLCKILRKFRIKFTKDIELKYEWIMVVQEPFSIELQEIND